MSENNIIIRIQGESDLSAAQSQIRELTARNKELEAQMKEVSKAEKEDAESIRQLGLQGSQLSAALKKNTDYYKKQRQEVQKNVEANKQSIQTLQKSVSQYNLLSGATGKTRQQLMEMREAMIKMAESGDTTSATFIAMADKAAELNDTIGDAQQIITLLASDTKNLDAAMQVGGGLVGAFNAATSAMALLGGESEELQKAFLKVQAAMSILNGMQQVMAVLDKRSAANVVIRTALIKLFNREKVKEAAAQGSATAAGTAHAGAMTADTVATTAATTATTGFTAALMANPFGAILAAVMALVAGFVALTKAIGDSEQAERDFNDQTNQTRGRIDAQKEQLRIQQLMAQSAIEIEQARGASTNEINQMEIERMQENIESKRRIWQAEKAEVKRMQEMQKKIINETYGYNREMKKLEAAGLTNEKIDEQVERAKQANEELFLAKVEYQKLLGQISTEEADTMQKAWGDYVKQSEDAAKKLQEVRVEAMQEGVDKEIEEIKLAFQRRLDEIKGISDEEIALRVELTKLMNQRIAEVEQREQKKATDDLQKLKDDMYLKTLSNQEKELRELQLQKNKELAIIQNALEEEVITKEESLKLIAQLDEQYIQEQKKIESKYTGGAVDEMAIINYNTKLMQTASKTEDEIWNYRYDAEKTYWQAKLALAEVGSQEYYDIMTSLADLEIENIERVSQKRRNDSQEAIELTEIVLSSAIDIASELFGIFSDSIQHQIEQLDEMYTTDAEEAKENANKKYISEKEMEDKKMALKRKQAALDKASAAFNIGLSTAMAIMRIWADVPKVDFGATTIAMTATAAALGAIQLAAVLAKPLPQYAKGRKGGKGEYALVGEKGPEVMYIPAGASIVPNSLIYSPDKWDRFGVPTMAIPPMPQVESFSELAWRGMPFDYDRFGKTMRNNMPEQKMIHINIDRSGVTVQSGNDTHTYMNTKYTGTWN